MSSYPPDSAGKPGMQNLPYRTTGGSVSDDEAVPEVDPTDVCLVWLLNDTHADNLTDGWHLTGASSGLEACCWLLGELHFSNRKGSKSAREGV